MPEKRIQSEERPCACCPHAASETFIDIHSFIESLVCVIEAKDLYTSGHSERVAEMSSELALRFGMTPAEVTMIHIAGHLHDIGKIGIPDGILLKNTRLSPGEFEVIKEHPVTGHRILKGVRGFGDIAEMVLYHHERWDGRGYPSGRAGEDIPAGARIIALADSFDAMTSFRSYRTNLSVDRALSEIREGSGTQFDPRFAQVFLEMMKDFIEGNEPAFSRAVQTVIE